MLAAILAICGTTAFASCTANDDNPSVVQPTVQRIQERGKLLVGTTGDYRPLGTCRTTSASLHRLSRTIVNERYDYFDRDKMKGDFLAYFKQKADKKNCKWQHVYQHFARFCNNKCRFDEINVDLCNKFREYLLNAPQTIHTEHKLNINSVAGYWSTFRAVLHTAYREHKIMENPNGFLERINTIPTEKEHLSKDELVRLANTPCQYPVLKTAFLFACLTGLRKSDIKQLTWENIQPYGDGGMYVTLRMQKTKELVNNPISDEALELIGERGTGPVFVGFADKMTQTPMNYPSRISIFMIFFELRSKTVSLDA